MLGAPPNCRPECVIHQECPSNRACIAQQCQDPCVGSCGFNARCTTQNHQPICSCIEGYEGDPYASCTPSQSKYKYFSYFPSVILHLFNFMRDLISTNEKLSNRFHIEAFHTFYYTRKFFMQHILFYHILHLFISFFTFIYI